MSQANVEKFFETVIKVQPEPDKNLTGTIDGVELSGEKLIKAAVAKGKKMGYEFTHKEAAAWIKQKQESKSGAKLSDSELDSIADVFGERDKFLDDKR